MRSGDWFMRNAVGSHRRTDATSRQRAVYDRVLRPVNRRPAAGHCTDSATTTMSLTLWEGQGEGGASLEANSCKRTSLPPLPLARMPSEPYLLRLGRRLSAGLADFP